MCKVRSLKSHTYRKELEESPSNLWFSRLGWKVDSIFKKKK